MREPRTSLVASAELPLALSFGSRVHHRVGAVGLFGALAAFTLCTLDGGDIAPRIISAVLLVLTACYFAIPVQQRFVLSVPAICLLLMTCYGIGQTLWSSQEIVYNGWSGVLFWFTAAVITLLATQLFQNPRTAARFRFLFVLFGSALCVLDLLEQASHTNRYVWLIPSRFHSVYATFAYWNNFAQFVELFLPITLWLGFSHRKPAWAYLVLSALQIGAVVASGSRAGTALVIAELVAVILLAYLRNRQRAFLYSAAAALLLSVLFIFAAGTGLLATKLQEHDQLAVRRYINKSSLEMIRQHPLTGWGLDTYVPVYPMFAHYDDGTLVNRAHNDWLQWTAEGGIFFSALMLIVFAWSIAPAVRSVWGIGVIAICLHAVVDYPFARFGVCGWYFAILGMLASAASQRDRTSLALADLHARR